MPNVLFVSIAFPPKSDPECIQTAKYFKYLNLDSKDLKYEVVTTKDKSTLFMPYDENLLDYCQGDYKKVTIPIYENKYVNFILRKLLKEGIDWPDSKFSFHKQWRKAIRKVNQKPNLIYSRSYPPSSTVMALKLKKHYNVPWVLHLSDPWAYSPLHQYSQNQFEYHKTLEKECFENADKICLTSKQTIEFYKNIYPQFSDKFEFFPNVYEQNSIKSNPIDWSRKLRIIYTGGLAGERSASFFINAINELSKEVIQLEEKIEIIFAGPLDGKNKAIFNNNNFSFLKHIGQLSFQESLNLQKNAHILLVIDNPISKSEEAMFFPSKLLDYLTAQRRILAITSTKSATESVVKDLLGDSFQHNQSSQICSSIKRSILAFENKEESYFLAKSPTEIYEASYNAKRLTTLFKSLF